jgi:hypothetical protein
MVKRESVWARVHTLACAECPKSHFTVFVLIFKGSTTLFTTSHKQEVTVRHFRNFSSSPLCLVLLAVANTKA